MADWTAHQHAETGEYLTGDTWFPLREKGVREFWIPAPIPTVTGIFTYVGHYLSGKPVFRFEGEGQVWNAGMSSFSRLIPLMVKGVYTGPLTLRKQGHFIYAAAVGTPEGDSE